MNMWIVAAAVMAAILAFLLVKPLFEPALSVEADLKGDAPLRDLLDEKERTLRALKDLELDYAMGKIGSEELEPARRALALEAGKLLEEIKRNGGR